MTEYFNIPPRAQIHVPISKKLLAEKLLLTASERRLLRDGIVSVDMRGLFQPQTVGLAEYVDADHLYNQFVVTEAELKTDEKREAAARLLQQAFPAPMFLVLRCGDACCVCWCDKRINRADAAKRVVEDLRLTRWLHPSEAEAYVKDWLASLDTTHPSCHNLKELYDAIARNLAELEVADETGIFSSPDAKTLARQQLWLARLKANREEQAAIQVRLKQESQFNERVRLTARLRELQNISGQWVVDSGQRRHETASKAHKVTFGGLKASNEQ
ncbi:MAG: DUF4391 domain-containing protein [Tannerella sp.]|jgi:hypothetical protein|nr:DUF4391 domain-containing protein [Tannerella sp.]